MVFLRGEGVFRRLRRGLFELELELELEFQLLTLNGFGPANLFMNFLMEFNILYYTNIIFYLFTLGSLSRQNPGAQTDNAHTR